MRLPIDLLQTFVVVAEKRNFTAAGKDVHRSQSAVSMQIKRLSDIVGRPLFDMKGKQIRLSPMGELVLEHAYKILNVHENAAMAISRSQLKGKISFGAPEDYASVFIPRILAGFAQEYPDIRVDVICRLSEQLYIDLMQGKLDLAICTEVGGNGDLIYKEPVVWVRAAHGANLETESIPLAIYGHECVYRKWAVSALEAENRSYHIAYMSPSIAGILAAVRSGLAVAPVGLSCVPDDLKILGPQDGFPVLPSARVHLLKAGNAKKSLIEKLALHVKRSFEHGVSLK